MDRLRREKSEGRSRRGVIGNSAEPFRRACAGRQRPRRYERRNDGALRDREHLQRFVGARRHSNPLESAHRHGVIVSGRGNC